LEAIATPKQISGCIVPFVVEAANLISERASRVSMHTRTQTALPASLEFFKGQHSFGFACALLTQLILSVSIATVVRSARCTG
jgi:hypothetical protein